MARAKRAPNGVGTIRPRADGRFEGQISCPDGKRRSVYGKTQAEVRRKMTAIQTSIDKGSYIAPQKMTVSEWFQEWLTTYCKNLKQYTMSSYEGILKNHIEPQIGDLKLQSVKGLHVQRLYNAMLDAGKAPKTVQNVGAILHKGFEVARKNGLISVNPCDSAELPKAEQHEITPLSDAEILLFLEAIKGHPFEAAYALCLFVGLREGECLGLSWPDVDLDKGVILIHQQLQKAKVKGSQYAIVPFTKSNKARTVTLPPIAIAYLARERKKQAENRLLAGSLWDNPNDLVFTNETGRNYALSTFYKRFKRIAASIGRPDARPHDLRHTGGTVANVNGADTKAVQTLLGHSTPSFTASVYLHGTERMKQDTAAKIQSFYDSLGVKLS